MTDYTLQNVLTKREFEDTGWMLNDPEATEPSLIRAIYKNKKLKVKENSLGIYKFSDWLPINRLLNNASSPITYKSKKLANKIGLSNLYITFNGYWPEKGADMTTASFKETEAYSVCARLPRDNKRVLVVASAGNTARAFAKVCSDNKIPLLLVVPYDNIDAMWFTEELDSCVKLVCTEKGSDYFDAIDLSNKVCKSPLFLEEGGARNIARRDGMGTTFLSAATTIGQIPDYYFQAIGSGTGTIAAWEANLRLIEDGSYGDIKTKLVPSQNLPFVPMYEAWNIKSRALSISDDIKAREDALKINAKVLSNRRPPYSIHGGLFDALSFNSGSIEVATNSELDEACKLFYETEGIDIHPAAGVALTGMMKSVKSGYTPIDKIIMLNITGGGEELIKGKAKIVYKEPDFIFSPKYQEMEIIERCELLFK